MSDVQFLNADEPKCVDIFVICINVSDEHDSKADEPIDTT